MNTGRPADDRMPPPVESWRPQRASSPLGPATARMGIMAAGVVGVLALGYGGYAMLTRTPRAVPLIEADSRPLRVKPDNPGGMQVAGVEEQVTGGAGTAAGDAMAPGPEVPQPQVLRAQIQAAKQSPAPPPAAPVVAAVPATPVPQPLPATAEPRAAVPAPAKTAAKPAPPPSPTGNTEVQLAAMDSEAAAMSEWQRLLKRMPDMLGSHRPAVVKAERDGKALYRLRTGGFADAAQATAFCGQVRAKGGGCSVANF